jgi:hypothetical protein
MTTLMTTFPAPVGCTDADMTWDLNVSTSDDEEESEYEYQEEEEKMMLDEIDNICIRGTHVLVLELGRRFVIPVTNLTSQDIWFLAQAEARQLPSQASADQLVALLNRSGAQQITSLDNHPELEIFVLFRL